MVEGLDGGLYIVATSPVPAVAERSRKVVAIQRFRSKQAGFSVFSVLSLCVAGDVGLYILITRYVYVPTYM